MYDCLLPLLHPDSLLVVLVQVDVGAGVGSGGSRGQARVEKLEREATVTQGPSSTKFGFYEYDLGSRYVEAYVEINRSCRKELQCNRS